MNKILILGCSFSYGSYELIGGQEDKTSMYSWYNELDKSFDYDVYAHNGGGYLNYGILLDEFDLDQYSAIIIQQTLDPRFWVDHAPKYQVKHKEDNITIHTTYPFVQLYRPYLFSDEVAFGDWKRVHDCEVTKEWQDFFEMFDTSQMIPVVNKAMYNFVDKKCEESGIPSFAFSLAKPNWKLPDHSYIKSLNTHGLQETIWGNEQYQTIANKGHFNIEGNKLIGETVKKALMNVS